MADNEKLDLQALDNIRVQTVTAMKEHGHTITEFTCDNCPARFTCEYVFDPYNTNSDCLANK